MGIAGRPLGRRELLAAGAWFGLGAARASELTTLDVAYAGSMGSVMEGPVKNAVGQSLKLGMHGRAQGASALAQLIVSGSIAPDVFIPITSTPMLTVLRAGKAETAQPIARTEMVIAYSPKSRFADRFAEAAQGKGQWWEVLQERGLRFGRTDPVTDPQGRNIIFTMMLAAKKYQQANLVEKVLGATINEAQIFTEPTVQARLQSGELDAASAYKIQPEPFHLPYITLPADINLSGASANGAQADVTLAVGGKTYHPEALAYYVAVLKAAQNPKGAAAFAGWLSGGEGQAILRRYFYDPPGNIPALHA